MSNRSLTLTKDGSIMLGVNRQIKRSTLDDLLTDTYNKLTSQGQVTKGALVFELLFQLRPDSNRAASLHRFLEREVSTFASRQHRV